MKIGTNKGTELITIKKTNKPEGKSVFDKVTIGGNTTDESLMMADQLKQMKSGDAGNAIANSLGFGLLGTIAGGVGAGFGASALGAGGIGIAGMAIIGGVVGGIAAFHVASNVLWFHR